MTRALLVGCALLALAERARAEEPNVSSTPSPIVLGQTESAVLHVADLPGQGAPLADVNVGVVERVETAGGGVRVHYRPPAEHFPQQLCIAVWRDAGIDAPVRILRLPLLAATRIPVHTRHHSRVIVRVGGRTFGPFPSGASGRVQALVVIPPGARQARVEVTDQAGLTSSREIAIQEPPAHNQLAMAIAPGPSGSSTPRFRITIASASEAGRLELQVGADEVATRPLSPGAWTALWAPARRPREGQVSIKAALRGQAASVRYAEISIGPQQLSVRTLRVRPERGWRPTDGLRGELALSVGLLHNGGELVAARVGAEVGLDYPLRFGRLGVRLLAGFARAAQRVAGRAGLADGDSTVMLIPLGGGVTYRMPSIFLSPYVFVGGVAQIVRTSNSAAYSDERLRYDVAPGVLALAGVEQRLGPGRLFLQGGYLWARVENPDIELLAGGGILDGGYRLDL